MKILITGGSGFIGCNLVEYLIEKTDWNLKIIDNESNSSFSDLKNIKNYDENRIQLINGDIRIKENIINAIDGCEMIVNLAAQTSVIDSINNPLEDADTNIMAVIQMLQIASDRGIKKFVHASSAAVLGEQEMPMHERKIPAPLCPYGASKLAGEAYCSVFGETSNMKTVALRFSNVYGEYSKGKGSVIPLFIKKAKNKEKLTVFGDGEQTRDFVFAKDICQGIYKALITDLENNFELIQLGTGKETYLNQFLDELKKYFEIEVEYVAPRPGEIIKNVTDISKAKKLLNYEPEVEFSEGLKITVESFK